MDQILSITGTSTIRPSAALAGSRQVLDGIPALLRKAAKKTREVLRPARNVSRTNIPSTMPAATKGAVRVEGKQTLPAAAILSAFILLVVIVAAFTVDKPPKSSHVLWMPATTAPLTAEQEADLLALEIEQSAAGEARFTPAVYPGIAYSGTAGNSVIRQASLVPLDLKAVDFLVPAGQNPEEGILVFNNGRVYFRTIEGNLFVENFAAAYPKLPSSFLVEGAAFAGTGLAPEHAGTAFCSVTPESGSSLLSAWSGSRLFTVSIGLCSMRESRDPVAIGRLIAQVNLPALASTRGSAGKYRTLIEQWATTYALSPSLVLAVMHTESNFNPFAVSPSNALGLMQVVPETAGNEVYRFLKGSQGQPSVETLLSPEHNIKYGTTYLHLLARRYFGDVIDPNVREMCMIAAYNGGPGAVLRVFDRNREVALATINSMTSDEVYETLTTRMPSVETRRYVEVVLGHQRNYAQ